MSVPDELLGTREIASPDEMEDLGRRLGAALEAGDVIVLTGLLGAGKTTLTRGIGEGLGIRGPVQSPTFVLARTHPSLVGGAPLVHVDAYRLGSAAEFDDIDIDVAHSVVVVEWGRGMAEHLADTWWEIEIQRQTGGRGNDNACGEVAPHTLALDDDAPRTLTITRHP
jgi:tRNA threonylcarbamoyladenosine biosynthesis protein TsaE